MNELMIYNEFIYCVTLLYNYYKGYYIIINIF